MINEEILKQMEEKVIRLGEKIDEIVQMQAKNLQQPPVIKSVCAKEFKTGGYCPVCFKEKMQCICKI